MSDHAGARYNDLPLSTKRDFFKFVVPKPRAGYEGWPRVKPRVLSDKKLGKSARLVSMELGLFQEDEACHLDHRVSEDEWRLYVG